MAPIGRIRAAATGLPDKKGGSHHFHEQAGTVLLRTISAKIMDPNRHKLHTGTEQHCQEK